MLLVVSEAQILSASLPGAKSDWRSMLFQSSTTAMYPP